MKLDVRTFGVRLLVVAGLGLVVRGLYTVLVGQDTSGIGDFFFYHGQANLLADGHGFVHPLFYADGVVVPSAEHPPLWPMVLSVTSWLGGTGFLSHRLTGCLVGTAAIVVVGLLGRKAGGERIGLIAAVVVAAWPTFIAADGSLMSESLYGLLVATVCLAALHLLERPRVGLAAVVGVLIGLSALTRSEALALLALLAVPVACRAGASLRPRIALAAAAVVAAVVVVAPWTIRNESVFHRFVPISINDSTVVAGANCASVYRGADLGFWQIRCLAARKRGGNEAVQAAVWRKDGVDYALDHPGRLPVVIAVRVLRSWDLWQPMRQVGLAEGRDPRVQRVGTILLYPLLLLAIAGAWLWRCRPWILWTLLAPSAAVVLSSAVGYGLPRFRHAAELVITVLAAVAIDAVVTRVRDRRFAATSA